MTDPAPQTRPAFRIEQDPPTRPASIVHPSWGVNVAPIPITDELTVQSGTAVVRGAHAAPDEDEDDEPRSRPGTTAIVTMVAMFCVTLCVAVVSLLGDPRGGAVLAGVVVVIGAGMAWVFRERWR